MALDLPLVLASTTSFQPEQLKQVIDFTIPADPLPLDQLLVDCKDTLKYQVKTGRHVLKTW